MFRRLLRFLWAWLPHRCRFTPIVQRERLPLAAIRCRRCGVTVWFDVTGCREVVEVPE
jgi:hypothetical protein